MKKFLYLMATDQINGVVIAIVKLALWILSLVYGLIVILRSVFYKIGLFKQHRLPCPVISVGNLTLGGAGKTPLVEFIARALKDKNARPVILTRGYMGERIVAGNQKSDEAMMLKDALPDVPILVGSDRVGNALAYLRQNKADVFLLDDGFQHLRLLRDLDIVVVDTTNPWGNGCLLPRGILREPRRALSRAHIFVLTRANLGRKNVLKIKNDLTLVNPEALVVETTHEPVLFMDQRSGTAVDLTSVQMQKVVAVSSIGAPDSFAQTLIKLGADIGGHFAYMDHHSYKPRDLERIVKSCQKYEMTTVVTTEKDAVKLGPFLHMIPDQIRVLSLKIKIVIIHGEGAFLERIHHIL